MPNNLYRDVLLQTNLRPVERFMGKLVIYRVVRTEMGLTRPHPVNREFTRRARAVAYLNSLHLDYGCPDAMLKTVPVSA